MISFNSFIYPSAKSPLSILFNSRSQHISLSYQSLKGLHKACSFDRGVKVVIDKTIGQVSLVGKNFSVVCSHHDTYPKGPSIALFKNKGSEDFSFIRTLTPQDLASALFVHELKEMI